MLREACPVLFVEVERWQISQGRVAGFDQEREPVAQKPGHALRPGFVEDVAEALGDVGGDDR